MKRIIFLFLVCVLSASGVFAQHVKTHEVQAGETLYSLARSYGVTVEDIVNANPKMGETLIAGQTIVIPGKKGAGAKADSAHAAKPAAVPQQQQAQQQQQVQQHQVAAAPRPQQNPQCKQMYLVGKKETVYSISQKFGITPEELRAANPQITKDKVKKDEYICIPYSRAEIAEQQQRREQQLAEQRRQQEEAQRKAEEEARRARQMQHLNVAVILPFDLSSPNKSKEAIKMLDFYEGFLLAVQELKAKGLSANIYAYEEKGTFSSDIDSILLRPEMKSMNLIVGPMRVEHIPVISRFAKENHIPHVVPFSTKAAATASSSTLFQVNTSISELYPQVYDLFLQRNPDANVVFLYSADKGDKTDYISGFKQRLESAGIAYKTANVSDLSTMPDIISSTLHNVLIPTSSSQAAFERLARKLNADPSLQQANISLFGHPEWQTFSPSNKQLMKKYNASFYATFYTNPNASDTQNFNQQFRANFHRAQFNAVPLYGNLGYDVGLYFLTGLRDYGREFIQHCNQPRVHTLQNPMRFQTNAYGTHINSYVNIFTVQ